MNWPALHRARAARFAFVLAGIIVGQVVLYGPSLAGRKILLPLDILAGPGIYLPQTPATEAIVPRDTYTSDLVYLFEPARRFAAAEVRGGRLPSWNPYQFAGVPVIWPRFSPFLALETCTESPRIIPWAHLVAALVAGVGAYAFFRRGLEVGFWPAAICAWCYPLTGFFIFWQGYATSLAVYWLPWLLLAVNGTVRGTSRWAPLGLGAVTALTLVSGHLDVAGQALLASGLYALWCVADAYGRKKLRAQVAKAAVTLGAGWLLGFMLAAPYLLPVLEYSRTGARAEQRREGLEERPPAGITALPQSVLPLMYGTMQTGTLRITNGVITESSAAAYAGMLATLLAAPLAFSSRRHRSVNFFLLLLIGFGLSWCVNLPGIVQLLRLPGLNLMSHNRLVFVSAFAVLALAAVGLDQLFTGAVSWRRWMWLPVALMAGLCAWCLYRAMFLPEVLETSLPQAIQRGTPVGWIHDLNGVMRVHDWFETYYVISAVWCAVGLAGWWLLRQARFGRRWLFPALAVLLPADLLWFAWDRNVQSDPSLYYPPVPALESISRAPPGRIIGYGCLPACLASVSGLREVRGYDGVDPSRLVDLVRLAAAEGNSPTHAYASIQGLAPQVTVGPAGNVRLPPVLDLLDVRYVIFRGTPVEGAKPVFQSLDYWVLENPSALGRAYVPERVELLTSAVARLERLGSPSFDPRALAVVETPIDLPAACRGSAEVVSETVTRVTLALRMETAGLVVLTDRWDAGWQAWLNGERVPVLIANHALRGVAVPAGAGTLEFRYEPRSFAWGLALAGVGPVALIMAAFLPAYRGRSVPCDR